jgi:hypothetical protein
MRRFCKLINVNKANIDDAGSRKNQFRSETIGIFRLVGRFVIRDIL